ncbi:MAG TPA: protein kinase [Candidatus Sulfopaludibacter sp.]|nr:protein kinase [Candidatus Sulfopaludibacter sp.]
MKIPAIKKREPLMVPSRVSRLARVEFERNPHPALLKEPAQFWDEIFIANEAYMLEGITHPRLRHKLAYDATAHRLFLEYVEGETLSELVKAGTPRTNPGRMHRLLQSVAETVADLHQGIFCGRPIVHNDLKSVNVLVPAAAPEETRLIDFSHSYFEGNLPPFIMDKKNNPAGTAGYTAPEKWDGDFTKGFKSDVFAFGVLAYYGCTGKHPFDGTKAQIEKAIREGTPLSPLKSGHHVLRNTAVIIMACLDKSPDRRPSMEQVAKVYADSASLYE